MPVLFCTNVPRPGYLPSIHHVRLSTVCLSLLSLLILNAIHDLLVLYSLKALHHLHTLYRLRVC